VDDLLRVSLEIASLLELRELLRRIDGGDPEQAPLPLDVHGNARLQDLVEHPVDVLPETRCGELHGSLLAM
jgi:hypothetical protein